MSGDLSSLAATCSALKDTEKQMQGVVDLLAVDKQVRINTWRCGKWCLLHVLGDNCPESTAVSVCILDWQGDGCMSKQTSSSREFEVLGFCKGRQKYFVFIN